MDINAKTSTYLGTGWTSEPLAKENLITVKNQLTMTTGLDYNVPDDNCLTPACLGYKGDAGSFWYYYNAPYRLMQDVIANATAKLDDEMDVKLKLQSDEIAQLLSTMFRGEVDDKLKLTSEAMFLAPTAQLTREIDAKRALQVNLAAKKADKDYVDAIPEGDAGVLVGHEVF